jgi:hypothetical protein
MENRKSQGMEDPPSNREAGPAARPPAATATLAALLLPAVSIVGRIAADADCPAVPPVILVPLAAGGLSRWRTNRWTSGHALAVGLLIDFGALLTPSTGDHLSSREAALLTAIVVGTVALVGPVVAGAAATLRGTGAWA